jgi:hypothetical protein
LTELIFGLRQVGDPPENARKANAYDSILDSFLVGRNGIVEVHVDGKAPSYVKRQISRRIQARFLEDIIDASVINGILYLEK